MLEDLLRFYDNIILSVNTLLINILIRIEMWSQITLQSGTYYESHFVIVAIVILLRATFLFCVPSHLIFFFLLMYAPQYEWKKWLCTTTKQDHLISDTALKKRINVVLDIV